MFSRAQWTEIHGLAFGLFFLLAAYALALECLRCLRHHPLHPTMPLWERAYLALAAASGWVAVLTGTFIVYPWYRAPLTTGEDIHLHPRALLLASPATASLHTLGMEWKEHVALLAPLAFTAAVLLWTRYRDALRADPLLRRGALAFATIAFFAASVAGLSGALLNKAAPVQDKTTAFTEAAR